MRRPSIAALIPVLLGLALAAWSAEAESPRAAVERGNQAYAEGRYDDAIKAYEEASVTMPGASELAYNRGAVEYQRGNYEAARKAFEEAAMAARDPLFESKSWYNLGNCAFREGERQRSNDPQKAVELLSESIEHYRKTLKIEPDHQDAAHNLEIARLTIKTILDEMKEKADQQKDAQNQQQQNQQQEQKEQQEQQSQQGEQAQEQPQEGEQQQQPQDQNQAGQEESSEQEKQAGGEEEEKEEEKQEASASQGQKEQREEQQAQQAAGEQAEEKKEDAEAEAQAREIIQNEQENREQRFRQPAGYRPVDKDW